MTSAERPEPDMTAAELALGLLDGDERAAAVRRILADPAFAQEVEAWRQRFGTLFAAWPDAAPSSALEQRVMRLAGRDGIAAPEGMTGAVGSRPAAANDRRWWMPVAMGTALAAMLVVGMAIGPMVRTPPTVAPPLLAAITLPKGGAPVVASYDRRQGEIRLAGTIAVPTGRSAQLWAIGAGGAPRPLGLMAGRATRLPVASANRGLLSDGTTLAISVEPVGGSPTGLPTGPVVATGVLTAA